MRATEIIQKALDYVSGERARTHGDKLDNHRNIAALQEAYIRRLIYMKLRLHVPAGFYDADNASDMMELLKVARRLAGEFNPDDYVDGVGYAGVSGECAQRIKEGE